MNRPVIIKDAQTAAQFSRTGAGPIDYNDVLSRLLEPPLSWGEGHKVGGGLMSSAGPIEPGLFSATDTSSCRGIGWGGLLQSWGFTRVIDVVFFP